VTLAVAEGNLPLRSIVLAPGSTNTPSATLHGSAVLLSRDREGAVFTFTEELTIHAGEELVLLV